MKDIGFILIVSTILWLLVDWLKPIWEASGASRYISMAVAAVEAAADMGRVETEETAVAQPALTETQRLVE